MFKNNTEAALEIKEQLDMSAHVKRFFTAPEHNIALLRSALWMGLHLCYKYITATRFVFLASLPTLLRVKYL